MGVSFSFFFLNFKGREKAGSLGTTLSLSLLLSISFLVPCQLPGERAPAAWPRWRETTRRRRPGGGDVLFYLEKRVEFSPPREIARRNPRSIFSLLPFAFSSSLSSLSLSLSLCPSSHHPVRRLDPRLPDRGQSSSEPDRAKGQGPEQRRSDGEENCGAADAAVERPEVRLPEPVLEFLFRTCKERGDRERRHRGQNGRNTREQRGRKATAFSSSSHIIARTSASSSSSFPFFFFYLVLVDSPRPGHHGRGGPALPRRVRPQQ